MQIALVTGAAGFIGSHLVDRLLIEGWRVIAVDNFDSFYSPLVKEKNVKPHIEQEGFTLIRADIRDLSTLKELVRCRPDVIVHLAAKVGVRPSIADPFGYHDVNVRGIQNLLELAKDLAVGQFVFASSSSIYGTSPKLPWCEDDLVQPISPYAATKLSGEMMGHVYAHLYGIRFLALRFFTVYGPRQRPDLAIHRFSTLLRNGRPLPVFGNGDSMRAYTFVDDVVDAVLAAMNYSGSGYEVVNVSGQQAVSLKELVAVLEEVSGVRALIQVLPDQPGDVPITCADLRKSTRLLGFQPKVDLRSGLSMFWDWLSTAR